jgi:2-phosphosulfolactate phosphatase
MIIQAFLTPDFNEKETQFSDSIVVIIDVLRASTTICTALSNGAKEIIACVTIAQALELYEKLNPEIRLIAGERNGIKPTGFDVGNSPLEYTSDRIKDKTIVLSTTNGTRAIQKFKDAKLKIIAGFVNFTPILNYIENEFETHFIMDNSKNEKSVVFICGGNNGRLSFEDTVCAGKYIQELINRYENCYLSIGAIIAKKLFENHSHNLKEAIINSEHAVELVQLGFERDIETALSYDLYPIVPLVEGDRIKIGF